MKFDKREAILLIVLCSGLALCLGALVMGFHWITSVMGSLMLAIPGAGIAIWVERRNTSASFKTLSAYCGTYHAFETRVGFQLTELYRLTLQRTEGAPSVLEIRGESPNPNHPAFSGELVFRDSRLRRASGHYKHDTNPLMFGFLELQADGTGVVQFAGHQSFINDDAPVVLNIIWKRQN